MMRSLFIMGSVCLLAACGSKTTDEPVTNAGSIQTPERQTASNTSKGHVSITATNMETEEQANGLITHCHITFDIDNRSGGRIKRLTMTFKPETSNEFDEMVHAAAGEQSLYFRDIPQGQSSEVERVMGLECEGLTTLNIFEQACSTKEGPCNDGLVKIDGGDFLAIRIP